MATTIREIAQKLNLSHTTVSRVLNNKKDVFVSDQTRMRVMTAAREMCYLPNLAARSLRDSKTNMVGVFGSPRIQLDSGLIPAIIRGIRSVLQAGNLDLFFAFSLEGDEDRSALPAWRFDGAIVLQTPTPATIRHLIELGQPFICINEWVEEVPCILCDDASGTRQALNYLHSLGHQRIAYANSAVWHFDHYSIRERHDTFVTWIREQNLPLLAGHEDRSALTDRTAFVRSAMIDQKATAVLAYDHVVAIDIMSAAQRLGLRIPQDFSLVGFNDEYLVDRLEPALTVVAPESEEMGRLGAGMLLRRLADETVPATTRVPEALIIRRSTAAPSTA